MSCLDIIQGAVEQSLNRNILECKCSISRITRCRCTGLNRNILECKSIIATLISAQTGGLNRNILECKYYMTWDIPV